MVPSVAAVARRLSLLLAISLLPTDTARAERGQWTPLFNLGGEAIHMSLVPDPDPANPDRHSRLIWWQNQSIGNVLRWPRPVGENCLSFPSLPPLGWSPGANIFCGGHAQLGDGRLLSVGGTEKTRQWGITDARTYEPTSGVWSEQEAMEQARWYPTATVLRDGRVLVTAGNKGEQFWMFGGRRDGAGPSSPSGDQVHRFGRVSKLAATAPDGYWDPSITPLADGCRGRG